MYLNINNEILSEFANIVRSNPDLPVKFCEKHNENITNIKPKVCNVIETCRNLWVKEDAYDKDYEAYTLDFAQSVTTEDAVAVHDSDLDTYEMDSQEFFETANWEKAIVCFANK